MNHKIAPKMAPSHFRWAMCLLLVFSLVWPGGWCQEEVSGSSELATMSSAESSTTQTTTAAPPTQRPKLGPVNFTLVEELFERALNETEVAAKWSFMDKQMREGVRSLLKVVFPHVVSLASDAKVSGTCSGAILKWILSLRNLRTWAVQMLDAVGKPTAGILEGSLTLFGNYKQCLGVRAPDEDEIDLVGEFREYFRGQYCVLELRPHLPARPAFYSLNSVIESLKRPAGSHRWFERTAYDELAELAMAFHFLSIRADLCVPSLCSRDDIQRVADHLSGQLGMRARVTRCEQEPAEGARAPVDWPLAAWALALGLLVGLVLVSSLLRLLAATGAAASVSASSSPSSNPSRAAKTGSGRLAGALSIQRSIQQVRHVRLDRLDETKPAFLYALRVLLVTWLAAAGLAGQLELQFVRELLPLRNLISSLPMQVIVNSSLAYESLLHLAGFTLAHRLINADAAELARHLVARYFRLMPPVVLALGLTLLTPHLAGSRSAAFSPVWHDLVDAPAEACRSHLALINLAFLQNLLPSQLVCLPHSWLLCVELQLTLLATPLVLLMNRRFDRDQGRFRLLAPSSLAPLLLALIGCLFNLLNTRRHSLPAAWFLTLPDKRDRALYETSHLFASLAHATPFFVGLFTGHLCRCLSIDTFSGRPYGRLACQLLLWCTCLPLMVALLLLTHSWSLSGTAHLDAATQAALYASLGPLAWSAALSLILFHLTVPDERRQRPQLACWLGSQAWLVRLGRLSLLFYLLAPLVNRLVLGLQEQAAFSSPILLGHTFLGNSVITLLLALTCSLLVELPCRRAAKWALGSRRQCSHLAIINRQLQMTHGPDNRHPSSRDSYDRKQSHHQQQTSH